MPLFQLTKRLSAIAELCENGAFVADIGTDHAFLPIYLIESQKCSKAIAADVVDGPLEIARKNIAAHNLEGKIEIVKSDGLENVSKFSPQNVVIAGMGGETIRDILSASDYPKQGAPLLILQPMTHCEVLREFLIQNGFSILSEQVIREQQRFYPIIVAKFKNEQKHYFRLLENEKLTYELGGIDNGTRENGYEYLLWRKRLALTTIENLKKSKFSEENEALLKYFESLLKNS